MSSETQNNPNTDDIPHWALHPGVEDGKKISRRRKSLECTSTIVSIPETEYVKCANSYQEYSINVMSGFKQWTVKRKYDDFYYLDNQLKKYVQKNDIPVIPPKRFIGTSTDPKFVEERQLELEKYLKDLVLCPAAWYVIDFVRFLENNDNSLTMLWNWEKGKKVQDVSVYETLVL